MSFMAGYLMGLEDGDGGSTVDTTMIDYVKSAEPIFESYYIPGYRLKAVLLPEDFPFTSYRYNYSYPTDDIKNPYTTSESCLQYYVFGIYKGDKFIAVAPFNGQNISTAYHTYYEPVGDYDKRGQAASISDFYNLRDFTISNLFWSGGSYATLIFSVAYTGDYFQASYESNGAPIYEYSGTDTFSRTLTINNNITNGNSYTELRGTEWEMEGKQYFNACYNRYKEDPYNKLS